MDTAIAATATFGGLAVCAALGLPRASFYRWLRPVHGPAKRRHQPRALLDEERARGLAVVHEPRFADLAPAEVDATLLDEGVFLCSERTRYRVLAENREVRERRNQLRHPNHFIDLLHVYPTMAEALKIAAISRFKDPARLSCCAE